LEGKVYENNLKAILELKAVIKHEFFYISGRVVGSLQQKEKS
jgi:hypothetical protein